MGNPLVILTQEAIWSLKAVGTIQVVELWIVEYLHWVRICIGGDEDVRVRVIVRLRDAEIALLETEGGVSPEYLPSLLLSFPTSVSQFIHNIIDFFFLPGFHSSTSAVLQTNDMDGKLKDAKDACN
ncbi:hypothetical protein D9757_015475 [Collybiopsis confluens]|uniref:Uncharacterized protein n=1 Tax=Collybiopsis confluens TaxID=2823264 RepID=A0A8H5C5P1_9AGAR|nr:hypothetical protein D9757_015475 [Collybiopsis confluens]